MVLGKLVRLGEAKTVRKLSALAAQVNVLEEDFSPLTDAEL
ncbi:MAG: hypothetical protein QOK14_1076, partial [Frankiaceae bacterium]|nr:hypothetical protein [Frankiaceae bacterium]